MFSKLSIFTTAALAALVVAIPTEPHGQCNTGNIECCQSVQPAGSSSLTSIFGPLLGVALQKLNVPIGVQCTPISVIGVGGGASCTQQPVCCQNNQFNGLVNIGCTPINL